MLKVGIVNWNIYWI